MPRRATVPARSFPPRRTRWAVALLLAVLGAGCGDEEPDPAAAAARALARLDTWLAEWRDERTGTLLTPEVPSLAPLEGNGYALLLAATERHGEPLRGLVKQTLATGPPAEFESRRDEVDAYAALVGEAARAPVFHPTRNGLDFVAGDSLRRAAEFLAARSMLPGTDSSDAANTACRLLMKWDPASDVESFLWGATLPYVLRAVRHHRSPDDPFVATALDLLEARLHSIEARSVAWAAARAHAEGVRWLRRQALASPETVADGEQAVRTIRFVAASLHPERAVDPASAWLEVPLSDYAEDPRRLAEDSIEALEVFSQIHQAVYDLDRARRIVESRQEVSRVWLVDGFLDRVAACRLTVLWWDLHGLARRGELTEASVRERLDESRFRSPTTGAPFAHAWEGEDLVVEHTPISILAGDDRWAPLFRWRLPTR